ncbi:hypothetical protein ABZP36_012126 [Zizania latifolia]
MRRSSSGARVSSEGGADIDGAGLPTCDPQSAAGRREAARTRALERAVHCIPLVLLLCALLLWLSASTSRLGEYQPVSQFLSLNLCTTRLLLVAAYDSDCRGVIQSNLPHFFAL